PVQTEGIANRTAIACEPRRVAPLSNGRSWPSLAIASHKGRDRGYLAALGQQFGRHHLVIGPLTRMPMSHVENCADVFALAATDPRASGQTLNVVDGPGERIWSYLSDYMRGGGQPGWRLPVP